MNKLGRNHSIRVRGFGGNHQSADSRGFDALGGAMVRNRDPFSTALASIRQRLVAGVYGVNAPIVIVDEARRLGLSTTPVREALAWLAGAGLVEHASSGGYLTARLDAATVQDLYVFRRDCLRWSLPSITMAPLPDLAPEAPNGVFDLIIGRRGSAALTDAFHRSGAQLERLGRVERRLLPDPVAAVKGMIAALVDHDMSALGLLIDRYHEERIAASAVLAFEATRAPPGDGDV